MEKESEKSKGEGCLKLFGVNILNGNEEGDSMQRKSLSLETLQSSNGEDGWSVSHEAQAVHSRKKAVHWSAEEHQNFLAGLEKLGKGNWAGISRNFVRTRTPTQVASHAQKYFIRKSACYKRNRRSSVFDIPLQSVSSSQVSVCLKRSNDISTQPRQVGATIEDLSTKNIIPILTFFPTMSFQREGFFYRRHASQASSAVPTAHITIPQHGIILNNLDCSLSIGLPKRTE